MDEFFNTVAFREPLPTIDMLYYYLQVNKDRTVDELGKLVAFIAQELPISYTQFFQGFGPINPRNSSMLIMR